MANQGFNSFWNWLLSESRDFPALGQQSQIEVIKSKCSGRVESDYVRIGPFQSGGIIMTEAGNTIPFNREVAEATWHRYQGLRQTSFRVQARDKFAFPGKMPHQMASSFAKPNGIKNPLPQNWIDCPNPIRAPAFIAAAIRCYCRLFTHLGFCDPDVPLSSKAFLQSGKTASALQKVKSISGRKEHKLKIKK